MCIYYIYCASKVNSSVFVLPSLTTLTLTLSPAFLVFLILFNSSSVFTLLPSKYVITSPDLIPAFSAGENETTSTTYIPSGKSYFFDSCSFISLTLTPKVNTGFDKTSNFD